MSNALYDLLFDSVKRSNMSIREGALLGLAFLSVGADKKTTKEITKIIEKNLNHNDIKVAKTAVFALFLTALSSKSPQSYVKKFEKYLKSNIQSVRVTAIYCAVTLKIMTESKWKKVESFITNLFNSSRDEFMKYGTIGLAIGVLLSDQHKEEVYQWIVNVLGKRRWSSDKVEKALYSLGLIYLKHVEAAKQSMSLLGPYFSKSMPLRVKNAASMAYTMSVLANPTTNNVTELLQVIQRFPTFVDTLGFAFLTLTTYLEAKNPKDFATQLIDSISAIHDKSTHLVDGVKTALTGSKDKVSLILTFLASNHIEMKFSALFNSYVIEIDSLKNQAALTKQVLEKTLQSENAEVRLFSLYRILSMVVRGVKQELWIQSSIEGLILDPRGTVRQNAAILYLLASKQEGIHALQSKIQNLLGRHNDDITKGALTAAGMCANENLFTENAPHIAFQSDEMVFGLLESYWGDFFLAFLQFAIAHLHGKK